MLNYVLWWQPSWITNQHKKRQTSNFVETYPKNILDFRSAPKTEHYVEERIIRETFMPKLTDDNVYKVVTIAHMMLHIMRCWIGQKE
jgi:hypothetical protein